MTLSHQVVNISFRGPFRLKHPTLFPYGTSEQTVRRKLKHWWPTVDSQAADNPTVYQRLISG